MRPRSTVLLRSIVLLRLIVRPRSINWSDPWQNNHHPSDSEQFSRLIHHRLIIHPRSIIHPKSMILEEPQQINEPSQINCPSHMNQPSHQWFFSEQSSQTIHHRSIIHPYLRSSAFRRSIIDQSSHPRPSVSPSAFGLTLGLRPHPRPSTSPSAFDLINRLILIKCNSLNTVDWN